MVLLPPPPPSRGKGADSKRDETRSTARRRSDAVPLPPPSRSQATRTTVRHQPTVDPPLTQTKNSKQVVVRDHKFSERPQTDKSRQTTNSKQVVARDHKFSDRQQTDKSHHQTDKSHQRTDKSRHQTTSSSSKQLATRDHKTSTHHQTDKSHRTDGKSSMLASIRDDSSSRATSQRQSHRSSISQSVSKITSKLSQVSFSQKDSVRDSTLKPQPQQSTVRRSTTLKDTSHTKRTPTGYPSRTQAYAPPTFHDSQAGALILRDNTKHSQQQSSTHSRSIVPYKSSSSSVAIRDAATVRPTAPTSSTRLTLIPREPSTEWVLNNLYESGIGITWHDLYKRGTMTSCVECDDNGETLCREDQKQHQLWLDRGRDYTHPRVSKSDKKAANQGCGWRSCCSTLKHHPHCLRCPWGGRYMMYHPFDYGYLGPRGFYY